jgi:class 3 adenylate cyclase
MKREQKVKLLPALLESLVGDCADLFLLFIDLCGSTEYKQKCIDLKKPDFEWISRQLIFLQRAADNIKKYNGTLVKTIGDSVFAFFDAAKTPEDIMKCAIEIIQSYENIKVFKGELKIKAKASIDFGETYNGTIMKTTKFDPIGLPVDRCARMNSLAKENEIVFSDDFLRIVPAQNIFEQKYNYNSETHNLKGIGNTICYRMKVE